MKKTFLILFFSFLNSYIYTQDIGVGGALNFLTGNKYLNYQIGPSLFAEYSFKDVPISIQTNIRFYPISELSKENNFSAGYSYFVFNTGASVNYYPVHRAIEPYIGLGIFYSFNRMHQDGNLHGILVDGTYIYRSISKVENNLSAEITGGIKFATGTSVNFIVELTQTLNKPGYDLLLFSNNATIIKKESFNFNSLFLRLGLLFRI